jgi:ATP-dependent DNA helicase RecG
LSYQQNILDSPITFVKGISPSQAETLQKELGIFTFQDLLTTYPFRYVDRTSFHLISNIQNDSDLIQIKGKLVSIEKIKSASNRFRVTASFKDSSGFLELVWFQGVSWIEKTLKVGQEYIIFGRVTLYGGKKQMAHPEIELVIDSNKPLNKRLEPVYSSTEKMLSKGLDNRYRRNIIRQALSNLNERNIEENLPEGILKALKLCSKIESLRWVHFPESTEQKNAAIQRIKFEEFFYFQLRLLMGKMYRNQKFKSAPFTKIGEKFLTFYNHYLPFDLTNAQKKVMKEIRADLGLPKQMNRLLQGDVGSGKTIIALLAMLIAVDNGFQACMMAPTEILAQQHYQSIKDACADLPIKVVFLAASVKGKLRNNILEGLKDGSIDIIVGTHALIEEKVGFYNLGLSIIDEQHRFGVAQRAAMWKKNPNHAPHILVMTATPIPRTLAMTVYGDLDVSVIDELPPGRKEIKTIHKYETSRPELIRFMKSEISKGRQIYVVYPLIEESEKLDLKNLMDGYDRLCEYFPKPEYQISIVHGRMKALDKDYEMDRFVKGITNIMVATTVIEVGVNVPNASVMVIENTERFGLSQLHQLRGRVGRGADQSFCVLMSDYKLSKEGKERISIMTKTNNGFEISEADLKLRGPGDIQGTQQSGILDFKLLNISLDRPIMDAARHYALLLMERDAEFKLSDNLCVKKEVIRQKSKFRDWGRIS